MRQNPSVTEVARNFAEYINRVAFRGERFVLMRGRRPVAELIPAAAGGRLGDLSSLLRSIPRLGEDAAAFEADLDAARTELDEQPISDPWAS